MKSDSVPPDTVTSVSSNPMTSSLNSKVTRDTLSPLLSTASTISTNTVGGVLSMVAVITDEVEMKSNPGAELEAEKLMLVVEPSIRPLAASK